MANLLFAVFSHSPVCPTSFHAISNYSEINVKFHKFGSEKKEEEEEEEDKKKIYLEGE